MPPLNDEPALTRRQARFGWLLAICLGTIVFCGALVWAAVEYMPECCHFALFNITPIQRTAPEAPKQ
jgi:hypothetical protein